MNTFLPSSPLPLKNMEPKRVTETRLLAIQKDLSSREPVFHRPEHGTTRADFATMMAEDFWEVGASGAIYSKEYVLDVLDQRYADPQHDPWETRDFYCQQIGAETYLLTYTLRQGSRMTRRATLWQAVMGEWQIRYHQGTVVQA